MFHLLDIFIYLFYGIPHVFVGYASQDGLLYIIGGGNNGTWVRTAEVYDSKKNYWKDLPDFTKNDNIHPRSLILDLELEKTKQK